MNQTILFSCGKDFENGVREGLVPDPRIGRGALVLAEGVTEGRYVSPEMETDPFTSLVMSWNTDTPQGSLSEAKCRVRSGGKWSGWMSWGPWSPFARRTSVDGQSDEIARTSTDTLSMQKGLEGDAVQLCCVLRREDAGSPSPALRLLAATFRLGVEDHLGDTLPHREIDLPAPRYSQMIRDPNIGSVMCSATTATVMMNARGTDLLPEETAMSCWDHLYEGFGNWSFTMAAAASWGFETWLTYADVDTIRRELAAGYPVGCNVAYSNTHERATDDAPFMENTPGFTAGHLLTVRGLTMENGREMVLVCDSYGKPDGLADRKYPLDQFLQAWYGILYILRPRLPGAGYASPRRVAAALQKTRFGDEFRLTVNGEELALSPDFCGSKDCCGGVVAYSLFDGMEYATCANRPFRYGKATANGNLFLPASQLFRLSPLGDSARLDVWIITDRGVTYTASLTPQDL